MPIPYWITFSGRASACVEAASRQEALTIAKEYGAPMAAERLPYPAEPRLTFYEHEMTDGSKSICPSFCFKPEECKGKSACPRQLSCCD